MSLVHFSRLREITQEPPAFRHGEWSNDIMLERKYLLLVAARILKTRRIQRLAKDADGRKAVVV
ncbi:hypothetical protein CHM34_03795 [Paludifilum halophilum]|uniref:Uncharacterized protein n=1 Tax=Paludifilum halophilum TaxID=1642702 RepID=A0A235B9E7_9BACL|nr:hypothetical protein CHM34_03795 [Paludifilum halophilum]